MAVFWQVIGTVLVFWAAHVYAGTVARHGLEDGRVIGLREAFRASLRRSLGLVASAMIPSFILLLGATKAVDDTVALWVALWVGVLVLAVLGWIAFARRGVVMADPARRRARHGRVRHRDDPAQGFIH